ncbi:unnamed protein product [Clavelina lepadiformis]|uniref:Amine oxidase n=2 Tax=Clavelina lepadiformis TaxID=159417 RepID=A0ABP0G2N8_CLALP
MESPKQVDVIVIGGGISGFTAAYHLKKLTNDAKSFMVLEAKDRIGGRTCRSTLCTKNGTANWDMGGQWVSNSQFSIMKLLKELNLDVFPQYQSGYNRIVVHSLTDVRRFCGHLPPLNLLHLIDLHLMIRKIEKMVAMVSAENPLACRFAGEWDEQTLQTFVEKTCWFSSNVEMMAAVTRVMFGAEPSQISLFYFLYYCSLGGGFEILTKNGKDSAQEYRLKDTASNIVDVLQEKIGSDNVSCDDPVVSICQKENEFVLVKTKKGKIYHARHVICAIPLNLVNHIDFVPPLPHDRLELSSRAPMGNIIKFVATYEHAFWRAHGDSGESVMLVKKSTTGPLSVTFDATTFNGDPAIVGFIGGEHAVYWTTKSKLERESIVIQSLVAILGKEAESLLLQYADKDWCKEPYQSGGPVCMMQPGCLKYFHQALRRPFYSVHWAGTETAQKWTGFMDGAVESGIRAASEVANRLQLPQNVSADESVSKIFDDKGLPWKKSNRGLFGVIWLPALLVLGAYFVYKNQRVEQG